MEALKEHLLKVTLRLPHRTNARKLDAPAEHMAAPFHGWESGSPRGVRSGVRLKRANGRGQTGVLTHHFARTARRATVNSEAAGNAK